MEKISARRMFSGYLSGAKEVMSHRSILNKINVFPVADGDTRTNLFSTMKIIVQESTYDTSVQSTLSSIADSALKGARGNSGIIFAQYLYGLSLETANDAYLTLQNFVSANQKAVSYAYNAVTQPVQGTILTVIQKWADSLQRWQDPSSSFVDVLHKAYQDVEQAVLQTTQQLQVLKQNKVVDSGAKGFALFIKGFLDHLRTNKEDFAIPPSLSLEDDPIIHPPEHIHGDTTYRYCSEAMLEGTDMSLEKLRKDCIPLGDSLLLAGSNHKARIHIHTDHPQSFFSLLSKYGTTTYQKVDDMKMQMDVMTKRKHPIAIVTDSIADIPQSFIDEHQIHVLPLHLFLGDTNYLDRLTIDTEEVLHYIDQHAQLPTSSQPVYKDVENTFQFLSSYYDSILVITVSSELSGTHNIVSNVAQDSKNSTCPIHVVDSKLNSGAQGMLVMKCAQLLEEGRSIDQIQSLLHDQIKRSHIYVHVKSIDNMIKAGRLSHRLGAIAKALHLHPIVALDENGKGTLRAIAFRYEQSKKKTLRILRKLHKKGQIESYSIVHCNNRKEAEEMSHTLETILQKPPLFIEEISSITSISAGRGAIAVSFICNDAQGGL
jgi:hypothetical protein